MTFDNVASGEFSGGPTATQLPDVPSSMINIKANSANAGKVYVGGAGVTTVNTTTDTKTGFELSAGEETGWMYVSNLNKFYRITDNGGDALTYLAIW